MDRLQSLGIPPATAPGRRSGPARHRLHHLRIDPARSARAAAADATEPVIAASADAAAPPMPRRRSPMASSIGRRVALSWVLCMTYGGVLLGGGLPYWVLTAAFLFLHILLLDETEPRAGVADAAPPADRRRHRAGGGDRGHADVPAHLPGPPALRAPQCSTASSCSAMRWSGISTRSRSRLPSARPCSAWSPAACPA